MSPIVSPVRARVRQGDLRLFARTPVECVASRSRYFGLVELHQGTVTLLGRCPLRGNKPPLCVELPGAVRRFATAPGFVCPGCRAAGGGLFVPETGPSGDLLHSCLAPYSGSACACGVYQNIRYVDCLEPHRSPSFKVRGELIAAPATGRAEAPAPPGVFGRVQPGGGEI